MEFLKDRDKFVHRIEEALCSASETHTQNERALEQSSLKIQYYSSLSAVINAITTRRITPEIIPINSLKYNLHINNTIFESDILSAYTLGRIDHNIYRLNQSLIFLVIFSTPIPTIFTLFKPFVLPHIIDNRNCKVLIFSDDTRFISYNNKSYLTSISGWKTKIV